ncbi:TonB-dependent receptor [Ectothiorhodospira mobilis]|nr:TonB-dependent receptor [Ectothiorhodospira mobilis]
MALARMIQPLYPRGTTALAGLLLAGACLHPAMAQEDWPTEQDYFMDLPVALTATRLQQPLQEAPASVTVIDREWLDQSEARNLADILRQVPGFIVGRENGNRPIVTYHALAEQFVRQVQVLVDGRSIYNPTSGGVQWLSMALPPEEIERIEVIRGPNAAAYGSNSFLAIINIITRHPAETRGEQVITRLGSNGIRDLYLRHGGTTQQSAYRLSVYHREDEGFTGNHDPRDNTALRGRFDWDLASGVTLTSQLGLTYLDNGFGSATTPEYPEGGFTQDSGHLHLTLQDNRNPDALLKVQYYLNFLNLHDGYALDPCCPVERDVHSRRHDLEVESHLQLRDGLRMVWGGGARLDASRSQAYLGHNRWVRDHIYRLFANLEWSPDRRWLVHLGGMYESNELSGSDLMPRLALVYMPDAQHSLRLVASRALRSPSQVEKRFNERLAPPPMSGVDLEPEEIQSFELGYHGQWLGGRLVSDVKLFRDRFSDLIQIPYDAAYYRIGTDGYFRNAGDMNLSGVEGALDYRPWADLRLRGGLSLLDANPQDPEARRQADSVPGHILHLGMRYHLPGPWRLSAEYYHYGNIRWVDDCRGPATDAGDGFLDLHLRRRLGPETHLALSLTDVLASGYDTRTPASLPPANRRGTEGYVSLSMEF